LRVGKEVKMTCAMVKGIRQVINLTGLFISIAHRLIIDTD
jgi:hypothetical protein